MIQRTNVGLEAERKKTEHEKCREKREIGGGKLLT